MRGVVSQSCILSGRMLCSPCLGEPNGDNYSPADCCCMGTMRNGDNEKWGQGEMGTMRNGHLSLVGNPCDSQAPPIATAAAGASLRDSSPVPPS